MAEQSVTNDQARSSRPAGSQAETPGRALASPAFGQRIWSWMLRLERAEETLADGRGSAWTAERRTAFPGRRSTPRPGEIPRTRKSCSASQVSSSPSRPGERSRSGSRSSGGSCGRWIRLRAEGTQSGYLARFALANQKAGAAQTYVAVASELVVGYHSLTVGEVALDDAPDRLRKGLARHPIPIMLLARLAVSVDWQGRGLGAGLLKDAMRRTLQAADIAGIRVFAVHAKDESAP